MARPRDVVYSVEFSPGGDRLACAGKDGTVRIWETSHWGLVRTIEASPTEVNAAAFAPDGETIATVDDEGKLKLWQIGSGRCVLERPAHTGDAVIARFVPDGKTIVTGGRDDGLIKLWDRSSGRMLHAFRAGERELESAVFSPDGSVLACVGAGTIAFWRPGDPMPIASIPVKDNVQAVAFSRDGTRMAVAHETEPVVRLWDVAGRRLLREFRGHTDGVFAVAFTPDDRTLVTGGDDQTIRLWDVATGEGRDVRRGHTARVWSVAVSPDGRSMVSAGADGTVKLWDMEPTPARLGLPIPEPVCLAFTGDGRSLTTLEVGPRWSVARWDVDSGMLRERTPLDVAGSWRVAAFSLDGRLLALANGDPAITVCDLVHGRKEHLRDPESHAADALEFSPDNRHLLVSRGVRLWDLSSHRVVSSPWSEKHGMTFSPSGDLIASLEDRRVGRWDLGTGRTKFSRRSRAATYPRRRFCRTEVSLPRTTSMPVGLTSGPPTRSYGRGNWRDIAAAPGRWPALRTGRRSPPAATIGRSDSGTSRRARNC